MRLAHGLAGAVAAIALVLALGWLLTQAPEALSLAMLLGFLGAVGWHLGVAHHDKKVKEAKERHPLSRIA